jgi:CTP:molybdopterin cytidylyltransferase MocA
MNETAKDHIAQGGLKAALAKLERVTVRVEVDNEGILYDTDTPDDMRKVIEIAQRCDLRCSYDDEARKRR